MTEEEKREFKEEMRQDGLEDAHREEYHQMMMRKCDWDYIEQQPEWAEMQEAKRAFHKWCFEYELDADELYKEM